MLFQPSNIYPSTLSGIGAGTVDVTQGLNVSWQVNGDTPMTAYQIKIYQNDTASTLKYDSGSVSVSPAFETHDRYGNPTFYTVLLSAATLSTAGIVNGYQYGYKMLITQWWGVSDYVEQTSASVFITRSLPTIAIDAIPNPVTSSSLTITATYAQAQGDPISTVDWVFALAGSESNPIKKTGAVNTQVLSFDADGLITGNTYSIMCTVVTANGAEASTGFVQFTVSYSSSSLGINYQLAQLKNSSAVYLSWDDLGSNILAYPYTDMTKTTNGITFTVNGEGDVTANGTASADAYFTMASGTLSQIGLTAGQKLLISSGYSGARIEVTSTNSSNVVVTTENGADPFQYIVPSTTDTLKFYIVIPNGITVTSQLLQPMLNLEDRIVGVNDLSVTMQPIQSGSGTPSPVNVRPISGRTGLTVYRTGFNLCQDSVHINHFWESGVLKTNKNANYAAIDIKVPVVPGEDYCVYVPDNTGGNMYFSEFDESESYLGNQQASISNSNFAVFTATAGTRFIAIGFYKSGGVSVGERICVSLSGANDGTYDPYNGSAYSVDWTSEAGTVYGGTLNVVTGVLTVNMASKDLGELSWAYVTSGTHPYMRSTGLSGFTPAVSNSTVANILCSEAKAITATNIRTDGLYGIAIDDSKSIRFASATMGTDPNAFKTDIAGVQLVYELSTPLTYQLTPQEVATLTEQNNVWSDSGDVSVGYTKNDGTHASLSGSIVTFSDSNAVVIPTPQFIPGITGLSIYRYLQGESALQHVYDLATGATSILDYYAPSQMQVSYLIVAHSGIGDLFLQTNQFTPIFWFYSILLCDTDSNGNYHVSKEYIFKYGVETGAVSNNNDPTLQKNFTPYPNRQPTSSLYKTGKLSGYIGKTNNLNRYSDTISLQNAIYEISASTLTKFIKTRKGDILMVDTASSIQMQTEDNTVEQALKATIDWVEVGDSSQGSIVSVSTDPFWPLP